MVSLCVRLAAHSPVLALRMTYARTQAQAMAVCAACGERLWDGGAPAETGATPELTEDEQHFDALAARWAGAILVAAQWTPAHVQRLAVAQDVVVAHRKLRKCCIFRAGRIPQPLGARCAADLLCKRAAACILMIPPRN